MKNRIVSRIQAQSIANLVIDAKALQAPREFTLIPYSQPEAPSRIVDWLLDHALQFNQTLLTLAVTLTIAYVLLNK